ELIAIVGPSGSGKSTFLTIAGALQTPSSGEVLINNKPVTRMKQKQLAHTRMEKIGFILQATNLVPFLSVKQQFKLLKKQKKDILNDEDYKNMMNMLGLNDLKRKIPREITDVEQKKIA